MLRIRYLFREAVHEVTVGDNEPVYRIPKQGKILLYPAIRYFLIVHNARSPFLFAVV